MCKLYVFSSYFINYHVELYSRIAVKRCREITEAIPGTIWSFWRYSGRVSIDYLNYSNLSKHYVDVKEENVCLKH